MRFAGRHAAVKVTCIVARDHAVWIGTQARSMRRKLSDSAAARKACLKCRLRSVKLGFVSIGISSGSGLGRGVVWQFGG